LIYPSGFKYQLASPELLHPELREGLMSGLEGALHAGGREGLLYGRLYLQVYLRGSVSLAAGHPGLWHPDLSDAGAVGATALHVLDESGEILELLHGGREGLHLRPFWYSR